MRTTMSLAGACALAAFFVAAESAAAREVVPFEAGARAGTIVVVTHQRRLYYVLGNGQAIRYPVGVGRAGKRGRARRNGGKYVSPAWAPPRESGATSHRCPPSSRAAARAIRWGRPR